MFVTFSQYIRYQRVRRNVWSDLCLRFCIHYKILNSKTRNIAYMVPRFDDVNNTLFFQNIPDLIKALGIGKMQKVLFWWKHWTRREINEAAYADPYHAIYYRPGNFNWDADVLSRKSSLFSHLVKANCHLVTLYVQQQRFDIGFFLGRKSQL